MGKCLITKLNASVTDSSILRLGEIRVKITKDSNPSNQKITLSVTKDTVVELIGDSYFTDSNLTTNLGKSKVIKPSDGIVDIYVNNVPAEIALRNKYAISDLTFNRRTKSLDLNALKFCSNLRTLNSEYSGISGDIASLKDLSMTQIYLSGSYIYGDIVNLKDMTSLSRLNINDCNDVHGDLSSLSKLTNLTFLYFNNSGLTGNISSLAKLTKITSLNLDNRNNHFVGNIESLSSLSNLSSVVLGHSALTGDLAKLPTSCTFANFNDSESTFSWSARPSDAKILTILGSALISNVDTMLIDQASREASSQSIKIISVKGSRTSVSDDAVAALQAKGYTVSIIPA